MSQGYTSAIPMTLSEARKLCREAGWDTKNWSPDMDTWVKGGFVAAAAAGEYNFHFWENGDFLMLDVFGSGLTADGEKYFRMTGEYACVEGIDDRGCNITETEWF